MPVTATDPDLAGARGKTEIAANQKTPKLPDMERAAQEQNSYEKQMKRSTLQSAICTESRPVGLGEVRTRPYRPREQRRKRTFGSGEETKFQQNACKSEPGAVTGSQKAPRKENECPRRLAKKSKPEKSAPERKRMYNEAKSCEGQRCQNVSKKADVNF